MDDPVRRDASEQLRAIARDIRAAGDIPLVRLDDDGVTPEAITLADELWLIAFQLDEDASMADARQRLDNDPVRGAVSGEDVYDVAVPLWCYICEAPHRSCEDDDDFDIRTQDGPDDDELEAEDSE